MSKGYSIDFLDSVIKISNGSCEVFLWRGRVSILSDGFVSSASSVPSELFLNDSDASVNDFFDPSSVVFTCTSDNDSAFLESIRQEYNFFLGGQSSLLN